MPCRGAGQPQLALPLLEEGLKADRAQFGADHPDLLITMSNLALAYQEAGKVDAAEALLVDAVRLAKANLGQEHHHTLKCMGNLAACYRVAGKLDLALPLMAETLQKQKAKFGARHPDTLMSMWELAGIYRNSGKIELALPLCEEVLREFKAKLGADHPNTLSRMSDLAALYWTAKRLDKSIPLFEEALRRQESKLGRMHQNTQRTVGNLGVNYKDAGRLAEAILLLKEAYAASRTYPLLRYVGPQLLDALIKAEQTSEAHQFAAALLEDMRRNAPKGGLKLASELVNLADKLMRLRANERAEPLLREALAIRTRLEPDAWTTFASHAMLGEALVGQGKHAEAEPLLLRGYEGMLRREATIPPMGKPRLEEAAKCLIALYEASGRMAQADKLKPELARLRLPLKPPAR